MTQWLISFFLGFLSLESYAKPTEKKQPRQKVRSVDMTDIDFSETMIDGKMKAPDGFFLQGRMSQTMTQMVRLRANFRRELRNSKSAIKSIVK
jgi:hypothetical protein